MLSVREQAGAGLVAASFQEDWRGRPRTADGKSRALPGARVEPYLMLLDMAQVRGVVDTSFAWHEEALPDDPDRKLEFDVGGNFFRSFLSAGLRPGRMPAEFRKKYRHWGSLSWKKPSNSAFAVKARTRQTGKASLVRVLLWRERIIDRDLRRHYSVKRPNGALRPR